MGSFVATIYTCLLWNPSKANDEFTDRCFHSLSSQANKLTAKRKAHDDAEKSSKKKTRK